MSKERINVQQKTTTHQLTLLWAFGEVGIGGVLHALKLPFTGIVVGGWAVLMIYLLGYFAARKQHILQALLWVLWVKILFTPYASLGAFLAVSFQGVIGYLLFTFCRYAVLNAYLLAIVALLESALQKLLVLYLFLGSGWVESFNRWSNTVLRSFDFLPTTLPLGEGLIGTYLFLYLMVGIGVGYLASQLPKRINTYKATAQRMLKEAEGKLFLHQRRRRSTWLRLLVIFLGFVLYHTFTYPTAANNTGRLVILLVWFVGFPLLVYVLRKYLPSKGTSDDRLQAFINLLPQFRYCVKLAWKKAQQEARGVRKLPYFMHWLIVLGLYLPTQPSEIAQQ